MRIGVFNFLKNSMNTKIKLVTEVLEMTTSNKMRGVLLKMFFTTDKEHVLSDEDKQEVYFLFELLQCFE